jgi:hypothetical protein
MEGKRMYEEIRKERTKRKCWAEDCSRRINGHEEVVDIGEELDEGWREETMLLLLLLLPGDLWLRIKLTSRRLSER